jgi:hypothetical protein
MPNFTGVASIVKIVSWSEAIALLLFPSISLRITAYPPSTFSTLWSRSSGPARARPC